MRVAGGGLSRAARHDRVDAAELLERRRNPFKFSYRILDDQQRILLEVPFDELLGGREASRHGPRPNRAAAQLDRLAHSRALRLKAVALRARADAARVRSHLAFHRSYQLLSQVRQGVLAVTR